MTLVARTGITCRIRIFLIAAIMLTSVENYINQYKWNQDLMHNLVDDYEIVYPFQIKDNSRVGINTKNHYYSNSLFSVKSYPGACLTLAPIL
uniref:Uncharacterized protein n=1 Tax=Romanomermis culicivorax TaxID=13658 RepID=A0A915HVE5_ROMCU